ncbi:hypothetical protein, partial [Pseudomonas savastanoi]|uniref:hypothetical protein n=1 Tax=Pseudomonas savastanoi TaxID=29438 RepID=UPI001C7EFE6A
AYQTGGHTGSPVNSKYDCKKNSSTYPLLSSTAYENQELYKKRKQHSHGSYITASIGSVLNMRHYGTWFHPIVLRTMKHHIRQQTGYVNRIQQNPYQNAFSRHINYLTS